MQLTSRAMMVQLGFIQDASDGIFDGQGIGLIDDWLKLGNDNFKTLLKNFQKPGGSGAGEVIISKAEMNIRLTFFFFHHKNSTSWLVEYVDITVPNIYALKKQQDMELAKETKLEALTINLKDVSETYEAIIQYM